MKANPISFRIIAETHNEQNTIGQGTHYAICEALHTNGGKSPIPVKTRFCIIFDEDHDERIVDVVEQLVAHGKIGSVVFIGERKGGVTILENHYPHDEDYYWKHCSPLCGDEWCVELGRYDVALDRYDYMSIINDDNQMVADYLRGIYEAHGLGSDTVMTHDNQVPVFYRPAPIFSPAQIQAGLVSADEFAEQLRHFEPRHQRIKLNSEIDAELDRLLNGIE